MKALTLWQPWAFLVAHGHKRIETRCWQTTYRGELAIHAAAKLPPRWLGASMHGNGFRRELALCLRVAPQDVDEAIRDCLAYGAVLAIARLRSIEPAQDAQQDLIDGYDRRELIFGNYEVGRYAWHLEVTDVFRVPIPAKGNRSLWNWTVAV